MKRGRAAEEGIIIYTVGIGTPGGGADSRI